MRALVIAAVLVGMATEVQAQDQQSLRTARGHQVNVIDGDSREWQGRLLDVAIDAIVVDVQSTPTRFPLQTLKRVDAHGDRIVDGAIKGAVVGVVLSLVTIGPRRAPAAALTYSLLGLGLDALNSCQHTVYRAPATPVAVTVSW